MQPIPNPIPLSLLDLALVSEGTSSRQALTDATELARRADDLGFTRFWVAEHHNMTWVASTDPAVFMAHLAANTTNIRLGSGGVMLPNHAPLLIAERFAMLEALYPGRIDLGIGRAPGGNPRTTAALRRMPESEADRFPDDLVDLMSLLGDQRADLSLAEHLRATPAPESYPDVVLLGSGEYSAELAGRLGLRFGFANHFNTGNESTAHEVYRDHFVPSPVLAEPYLIVTTIAIASDCAEDSLEMLGAHHLRKLGTRRGTDIGLLSDEAARRHPDYAEAMIGGENSIVGTGDEVADQLHALSRHTGADELMLTLPTSNLAGRVRSLELTAESWLHPRI